MKFNRWDIKGSKVLNTNQIISNTLFDSRKDHSTWSTGKLKRQYNIAISYIPYTFTSHKNIKLEWKLIILLIVYIKSYLTMSLSLLNYIFLLPLFYCY